MAKLISVTEAARRLGLHPTRIRVLCREGRIQAERIGSVWVIDEAEIERFAKIDRPPGKRLAGQ